ncbi:MAG: oligosaccharide flippase family protein, partial [Saprospiraceae bacterium]|nr:oligosaccharide flippase family protein [Saprospiraceae bacterium]
MSTIWVLATLRYDLAIAINAKPDEKKQLLVGSGLIIIVFVALLYLLLFGCVKLVPNILNSSKGVFDYYALISLSTLLVAISFLLESYAVSNKNFLLISLSKASQLVCIGVSQICLGIFQPNSLSLIIGYNIGFTISILILSASLMEYRHNLVKKILNKDYLSSIKKILWKNKSFPLWSMPSYLANLASFNVPIILIGTLFSQETAGFFFMAQRIIGIPIDILTGAISQVFLGNSANLLNSEPKKINALFINTMLTMTAIGFFPFVLLFTFSEDLVVLIFGKKWLLT